MVVIRDVLAMMTPHEIVNLSSVSSKAESIVKLHWNGSRYQIGTEIKKFPSISYKGSETTWKFQMIEDENFRVNLTENLEVACEKCDKPMKRIMDWFSALYNISNFKVSRISIDTDGFTDESVPIFMMSKSVATQDCEYCINGGVESDDVVNFILKTLDSVSFLFLDIKLSHNYQGFDNLDAEKLVIDNGEWLTFKWFLKIRAAQLSISNSNFSNQELSTFFKSWMAMETHCTLEYFLIDIGREEDLNEILSDLPYEFIKRDPPATFQIRGICDVDLTKWNEIKRDDGARGLVVLARHRVNDRPIIGMIVVKNNIENVL